MDRLATLVVAAVLAAFSSVAGAQQWQTLPASPGWAPSSSGNWTYAKPPGSAGFNLGTWYAPTAANVGGRALTVPTYLPIDRTKALSKLLSAMRLSPAGLLTSITAQWLLEYGLERLGDGWVKREGDRAPHAGMWWTKEVGGQACTQYTQECTFDEMEQALFEFWSGSNKANSMTINSCTTVAAGVTCSVVVAGTYTYSSGGSYTWNYPTTIRGYSGAPEVVEHRPATEADWELVDDLPDTVIQDADGKIPWPVGLPIIEPQRIPVGSPEAIPDTQPQQYRQPVIDLVPRTTTAEPWRIEVIPREVTTPTPLQDPIPLDPENPGDAVPRDGASPLLCDVYPEILACQELDEVEDPDLEVEEREIELTPGDPWGAAGFCPATRYVANGTIPIPFDLVCMYLEGLRPIVISMAWLAAGFIVLGVRGGD